MRNFILFFLFIAFSITLFCENQDVINLNDGTTLKGKILESNEEFLIIKTSLGEIKIDRSRIRKIPVTIYLKDENIIKGSLIQKNDDNLTVETSLGTFNIEINEIEQLVENKETTDNISDELITKSDNEKGIKAIGDALLYQQRQKKISTALGFQALGAGLLYTEKYTLGSIMLVLENGLIVSGALSDDPDVALGLWVSGLLIKGLNTFFTIKAVNDYNNKLMDDLNIDNNSMQVLLKNRDGFFYVAPITGIKVGYKTNFSLGILLGYDNLKVGRFTTNIGFALNDNPKLMIQYEKPFPVEENLSVLPKIGIGWFGDLYRFNDDGDYYTESKFGMGVVLGISAEYNITKRIHINFGYNLYNAFEKDIDEITHSTLLFTFGFRL